MWRISGDGWPPRAAWPGILGSGVLWFGLYMITLNWGEREVDAGTAALVVTIGPILIALLGGLAATRGVHVAAGRRDGCLAGRDHRGQRLGVGHSGFGRGPGPGPRGGAVRRGGGLLRGGGGVPEAGPRACHGRPGDHVRLLRGHGGLPAVRRATGLAARPGPGQRHAERRLPGPVPDHAGLYHLGVRAGPDALGEDGRDDLCGAGPGGRHVLAHPRAGAALAHADRRGLVPGRRRGVSLWLEGGGQEPPEQVRDARALVVGQDDEAGGQVRDP